MHLPAIERSELPGAKPRATLDRDDGRGRNTEILYAVLCILAKLHTKYIKGAERRANRRCGFIAQRPATEGSEAERRVGLVAHRDILETVAPLTEL